MNPHRIQAALVVLLMSCTAAIGEEVISAPFVTAKAKAVSNKPAKADGVPLIISPQAQHQMIVTSEVRFFAPPAGQYEIQCFFLAKSDAEKARYIFSVATHQSTQRADTSEFQCAQMEGNRMCVTIPVKLPPIGTPITVSPQLVNVAFKGDSKVEGWVLRVVYNGRVLKVESSQPALAQLANSYPTYFDTAAAIPQQLP